MKMTPVRSLSFRLLLFNILLLFLPMGSLLYLDTYESQLLASQEASMIQQGRLLGSALSSKDGSGLKEEALRILRNLDERVDARIRVVDSEGKLLADSATVIQGKNTVIEETYYTADTPLEDNAPNTHILYRLAVFPINFLRRLFVPPAFFSTAEFYSGKQVLLGPEVITALEGRYGSTTRYSTGGQVSVTLYSAIPVFAEDSVAEDSVTKDSAGVIGAVLVSRSSFGILRYLYQLRLDIVKIFSLSLAVSLSLSLLLSLTITRPLKKLKTDAGLVLDTSGKFSGHFRGLKRKDEIGDLSRSLAALSERLEKRSVFIDTFISDLYHEMKNPLTALRGQVELSLASPAKEEKLLAGIYTEEQRMERLLSRLRELSGADSETKKENRQLINLAVFIPLLAERYNLAEEGREMVFVNNAGDSAFVFMNDDSLTHVLVNPLDNAISFSPHGGKISIILDIEKNSPDFWCINILDEGPGICEESRGRYFDRFYSERSGEDRSGHSGLGLAIVSAICESEGGNASLENRAEGGARFILRLKKDRGIYQTTGRMRRSSN